MNAPENFEVKIKDSPNGTVASLCGDASNDRAQKVRTALNALLEQRAQRVVIDLRELHYIASMTLAELIHFRRELQAYGGRLRLAGASAPIVSVFETTHLADLFPMYPTAEQALDENA